MRNLSNSLKEYLSKSTDFATQITGDWGQGKTYYYRNTLQKLVHDFPTPSNANKNYKPIYISLLALNRLKK